MFWRSSGGFDSPETKIEYTNYGQRVTNYENKYRQAVFFLKGCVCLAKKAQFNIKFSLARHS